MQSVEYTLERGPSKGQTRQALVAGEDGGVEHLSVLVLPGDRLGHNGWLRVQRQKNRTQDQTPSNGKPKGSKASRKTRA